MPQTHSHSSRKSPKSAAKNNRANLMAYLDATSGKSANRSGEKSKGATLGHMTRKRKSSSSVSSVSSLSSVDELSDEEDGSEDADDEDDTAPSHDVHKHKGSKTGSKSFSARKKAKLSDDDGYEGQQSNVDSDSDSSDDDYAAVDEIMDADDEDQELEKLEEQLIVESEDEHNFDGILTISDNTVPDEWAGLGSLDNHMLFSTTSLLDEEQLYAALETFGETDMASETVETPVQRRVHFQEDSDSSSDSEASDDEIPGDFLQQDSLDPDLRRMIENDNFDNHGQRSDDIFGEYEFGQGNIYHAESDAISEESSGYETDDGETTDEDLPPPATITHPRSILRRDSTVSLTAPDDTAARRSQPPRRRGPIMGSFIPDPHKPVALVDCTGKHLVIIPAYASSRHDWLESATNSMCGTANNSPRATTMQLVDESDTDALVSPSRPDLSPMLTSSANLMMTALGNDATPGGQVMGPPEAFYPSRDFGMDSSFDEEDDDDDEAALNVDDFIDFGNGSSDEETDRPFDDGLPSPMVASSVQGAGTPTPNRNGDAHQGSSAERFLNHLDRGIVTAFRRNHNRYQTLIRLPQHREFMPANSPSRPASVFRHSRHMDPKTPSRKRKSSSYAGGEAVRRKLMDAHRRTQLPF
ncbi:hypothetical protein DTO166G4_8368 [Paecilomyces variotii]|nr:hypothetical protein DTO166G4_8368 [Paecilomyces variotii]KAJ9229220.1 hypothetical protein DTO166G5_8009 [Paecilomyces variotii]KAJ9300495.1 hypothetical protein DTO217A2_7869 [Paecilomyces variotii]